MTMVDISIVKSDSEFVRLISDLVTLFISNETEYCYLNVRKAKRLKDLAWKYTELCK
jgi:hypothetical protein